MDKISTYFYELAFKEAFIEKRGEEFQDFFATIMEKRYPADFIRVRPWGNVGDRKNDGYLSSKRYLFQCYAPTEMNARECIAKIDEDFSECLVHWEQYFSTWIFVHNDRTGLGPDVVKKLLQLGTEHTPLKVAQWGRESLFNEVMALDESQLASLLGPAPSTRSMMDLGLQDLTPVLDHIQRLPAIPDPDLRPVPADKLSRNMLSDAVGGLLRAGMSRADLVRKYFAFNPELRDQLSESFKQKYFSLRSYQKQSPDEIFADLQRFAAGDLIATPMTQNAVLATLAFFFEECDIFDRGTEPAP
jgi:hypothetical protein